MRHACFKFDKTSFRGAGRPAENACATNRSKEAAQDQRERPLFFFRKQMEQRGRMDHGDVPAQLIQRTEIREIRGFLGGRPRRDLRFVQEVCFDECGGECGC